MKRISLLLIGLFLCYIVYYDLKVGTLPVLSMTNPEVVEQKVLTSNSEDNNPTIPYYEKAIKNGDTVLSITEQYHGRLPTSIERLIEDFETLNSKVKAESIIIGKTYRFPDYKQ